VQATGVYAAAPAQVSVPPVNIKAPAPGDAHRSLDFLLLWSTPHVLFALSGGPTMFQRRDEQTIEPMLLTARQAARVLSISERTLWSLTKDGQIPAVRIGRAVRYDPEDLRRWINLAKDSQKTS
jgi:excisionase family DNA binding protein